MDMNELETWIKTSEGQTWADTLKKPLIDKRDELLSELKAVNGRFASEAQRAADSLKLLDEERAAIRKAVIDAPLAAALEKIGAPPGVVPGVIAELKEVGDFQVKASGLDRSATVILKNAEGKPEELDLGSFVDRWNKADGKRKFTQPWANQGMPPMGGTAPAISRDNLASMSAEEILANLPALTRKA